MYNKIAIAITILSAAGIVFFTSQYHDAQIINAVPADKVKYLTRAADNFFMQGFIICFISWVALNIIAIQTNRLFWLFIPLLLTIAVAILISSHAEDIFHYKKINGMWKGGFSLSYLFSFFIIVIAAIITAINYFVLLYTVKSKSQVNV